MLLGFRHYKLSSQSRNLEKNFSNLALRYLDFLNTDRIIVQKILYVLRLKMKTYP
ncbi:hypothetical protein D3C80_813610 [compost metagenome]